MNQNAVEESTITSGLNLEKLREELGSDHAVLEFLVTEVTKNPSDEGKVFELSLIFLELAEQNPENVKTFLGAEKMKRLLSGAPFFIGTLLISSTVQAFIRGSTLDSPELSPLMYAMINHSGNAHEVAIPLVVFGVAEFIRFTLLSNLPLESRVKLEKMISKITDIGAYLFPIFLAALMFIYNLDVETAQVLPYTPWSTKLPGTPDTKDIYAGIYGIITSVTYFYYLRKHWATLLIVSRVKEIFRPITLSERK